MKKIYALFAAVMMTLSLSATTLYCKMTQSWWTADGAAVGVYYWGSASSNPTWPGYRMTSVGDGVWSFDVPADVTVVIFSRVNGGTGAVSDWGAQTKNLNIPTDGKNLFTITNTEPTWGNDPGCDGVWSVYEGAGPGPQPSEDAYWYWKGNVDGVEINNQIDGGVFYEGLSEITVSEAGYIFVVYQVQGSPGVQYMTDGWLGTELTHATMSNCGTCNNGNKLYIPAGTYTLYLYDNGNNTVELSRESLPGKTLVGGSQNIENTPVGRKARKAIVNGQLVIIRGDKMFDATGRQL